MSESMSSCCAKRQRRQHSITVITGITFERIFRFRCVILLRIRTCWLSAREIRAIMRGLSSGTAIVALAALCALTVCCSVSVADAHGSHDRMTWTEIATEMMLDPTNPDWHRHAAIALEQIGDARAAIAARAHLRIAEELQKPVAARAEDVLQMHTRDQCVDEGSAHSGAAHLQLQCGFGSHIVSVRGVAALHSTCVSYADHLSGGGALNCPALLRCLGQRECALPVQACGVTPDDVRHGLRVTVRYRCRGLSEDSMRQLLPVLQEINNFYLFESHGVHVSPVNYYQPVPHVAALPASLFAEVSPMRGVPGWVESEFLPNLQQCARFRDEIAALPADDPSAGAATPAFHHANKFFAQYDAALYYCVLRLVRPRRVLEVGAGWSTLLAARALQRNRQDDATTPPAALTAVDLHPMAGLEGVPGVTRVVAGSVYEVPLDAFRELQAGDVLFIDGSHVLHLASDVRLLYLEVLPLLAKGVLVHVHDIFLPYHYPEFWLRKHLYMWNEQYALHALLQGNAQWRVLLPGHWLHRRHPHELAAATGLDAPADTLTSSFWMQKRE